MKMKTLLCQIVWSLQCSLETHLLRKAFILPSFPPTTNTTTKSKLRAEFVPAVLTSSEEPVPTQVPPGYSFHFSQPPQERSFADMFGVDEGESYDDDLADIEGIW